MNTLSLCIDLPMSMCYLYIGRFFMKKDIDSITFTPNGYDVRYSNGFYNNDVIKSELYSQKIKDNILKTIALSSNISNCSDCIIPEICDIDKDSNICESCKEAPGEISQVYRKNIAKGIGEDSSEDSNGDSGGVSEEDVEDETCEALEQDIQDSIIESNEEEIDAEIVFERLISKAKSDFLAEYTIDRISKGSFNKEPLKCITILESCFAEKEKLLPGDMFVVLNKAINGINVELSATERVVIFKDICENSKYTYAEKISSLYTILEAPNLYSKECLRHIKNKIDLLNIVKNSGFVIDFSYIEEKERKKREYQKRRNPEDFEDTDRVELEKARALVKKSAEEVKILTQQAENRERKLKAVANILTNESSSAVEKLYSINNVVADVKQPDVDSLTKTMVNSNEYFKFGAGVTLKCNNITITVPSGYIAETSMGRDKITVYSNLVSNVVNENNLAMSPLIINIEEKPSDDIDMLYKFFNKHIDFCRQAGVKYKQTTVGSLPAVSINRDNKYTISLYNHKKQMIYNIEIKFNVNVLNKESTVRRIVSGIKIGGKDELAI